MTVVEPLADYAPATVLQESIDKMRSLSEMEHLRYKEDRTSMVIGDNKRELLNDSEVTGDDNDRDQSIPNKQSPDENHQHYKSQLHSDSVNEEGSEEAKDKEPSVTPRFKFQGDSPRRLQIQSPLMSSLTAVTSPTTTPKLFLEGDGHKPGRRMRTTFSTEQKQALELAFQKTPYPDSIQREMLAAKHQIPEARVQVCKSVCL